MSNLTRIVLTVDRSACFDAVAAASSDLSGITSRLGNAFFVGQMPDFIEAIGLAAYGVTVESVGSAEGRTSALEDVIAERTRQIAEEGWTPEHDDQHGNGELARAAQAYAVNAAATKVGHLDLARQLWPFDPSWFKQAGDRRELVKACALMLAEIERIDRAAAGERGR